MLKVFRKVCRTGFIKKIQGVEIGFVQSADTAAGSPEADRRRSTAGTDLGKSDHVWVPPCFAFDFVTRPGWAEEAVFGSLLHGSVLAFFSSLQGPSAIFLCRNPCRSTLKKEKS